MKICMKFEIACGRWRLTVNLVCMALHPQCSVIIVTPGFDGNGFHIYWHMYKVHSNILRVNSIKCHQNLISGSMCACPYHFLVPYLNSLNRAQTNNINKWFPKLGYFFFTTIHTHCILRTDNCVWWAAFALLFICPVGVIGYNCTLWGEVFVSQGP